MYIRILLAALWQSLESLMNRPLYPGCQNNCHAALDHQLVGTEVKSYTFSAPFFRDLYNASVSMNDDVPEVS